MSEPVKRRTVDRKKDHDEMCPRSKVQAEWKACQCQVIRRTRASERERLARNAPTTEMAQWIRNFGTQRPYEGATR